MIVCSFCLVPNSNQSASHSAPHNDGYAFTRLCEDAKIFIDFLDSFDAYCQDVKVKCCYVFELVTKLRTIYFCHITTKPNDELIYLFLPYPNFFKANSSDERTKIESKKSIYFCQFTEVCNFVLLEFLCLKIRTTRLDFCFSLMHLTTPFFQLRNCIKSN